MLKQPLFREFEQAKKDYEEDCRRATQPIRAVHGRYRERTQDGVRGHFELALCNLSLTDPRGLPLGSTLRPAGTSASGEPMCTFAARCFSGPTRQ